MSLPRVVPDGGFEVDGHYLPAGSTIGANPWVIHQNKEVYGDDVNVFRPERWLKEDNGDMYRFFFAFGAGARVCLGKNIRFVSGSILEIYVSYTLTLKQLDGDEQAYSNAFFALQPRIERSKCRMDDSVLVVRATDWSQREAEP